MALNRGARRTDGGGWGFSLLLMLDFTLAWSAASGCVLHTGTPGCYWSAREKPCNLPGSVLPVKRRRVGTVESSTGSSSKLKKPNGDKKSVEWRSELSELFARTTSKRQKLVPATFLKSNLYICWSIGTVSGKTCCSPGHVAQCVTDWGWWTVFQKTAGRYNLTG